MRTAGAGGSAFLNKPAAILTDTAWRQRLGDGRHQLHQLRREAAVGAVEMATRAFLAGRGNAKDLSWRNRTSEREKILRIEIGRAHV